MTQEMQNWRENEVRKWTFDLNNFGKPWPGFVEILKLEDLLVKAKIPYEKRVKLDGWIIVYKDDQNVIGDVVEHSGSYGSEADLLEAYKFDIEEEYGDDIVYNLTAEEAFEYFKRAHEKRQNNS